MNTNELSFMVGGHAGQGVNTVGDMFARTCTRMGFHVFMNMEYPSNIRGEHSYLQVMVSSAEVGSHTRSVDILLALDAKTVNLHQKKISPGGALIYDSEGVVVGNLDTGLTVDAPDRENITVIDIPFQKIIKDLGGSSQMLNVIGLGAVMGLLGIAFDCLKGVLESSLAKLEAEELRKNLDGAEQAFTMAQKSQVWEWGRSFHCGTVSDRMLLTGNHAIAIGAIKAGVKFYAAYPMTPASSVLGYLSRHARDFGIVTVHPEDEIAAAGMTIGASFAGARAMTGTSGGGFCLMSEYLGLAGMTETPLVILESQRPGPATGLPTKTEQGDLEFVLSAHQGDFPRIVIAPGDPSEAFYLTFEAFNLADRYQTPVIILSDKHLSESTWTYEPFGTEGLEIDRGEVVRTLEEAGEDYRRFRVTDSGVSPRALPGTPGGVFRATGNEHTEYGLISENDENRTAQMEKRLRKTVTLDVAEAGMKLHGDPEAEITLVGWGSTKRVVLDALDSLKERKNIVCNFLQIIYMEPFPVEPVTEVLDRAKRTILVENNATGQLGDLIRQKTGRDLDRRILKYNGRQFFKDELAEVIEEEIGP